jgi:sigma-E factor negative regulatory protein RseA
MTKELSALLDGEIEQHETPALWSALKADGQLRTSWGEYQLIGDALRGEGNLSSDITSRVMDRLSDEPVVLSPRPTRQPNSWQRSGLAMAASVAGIAVVGWLALSQQPPVSARASLARLERPAPPAGVVAMTAAASGMQEYLLAHQANAPGLHLQGGAQHIRTVSAVGKGQ